MSACGTCRFAVALRDPGPPPVPTPEPVGFWARLFDEAGERLERDAFANRVHRAHVQDAANGIICKRFPEPTPYKLKSDFCGECQA